MWLPTIKTVAVGPNKNLILYINEGMGLPDRGMALREKFDLGGVFMK